MTSLSSISAAEAKDRISAGQAVLIDIREADEYARAHIPGSGLLPLSKLDKDQYASLAQDKSAIFLCASGARTQGSCLQLAAVSGGQATILEGGLAAWQKAGGDVTVDAKAPLPIMRQVQIIAGSLILAGVILGQAVNPAWIGLSAFVGAGLLFAGLTGFCGMARMLAVMPWNK